MGTVSMTVLETPFFLRKAAGLLTEDERDQLVTFLAATPEAGDLISETGGVRKLRWSAKGKGKRSGNQQANLTKAERNELRKLVPLLVRTYSKR
jgi:hypothetical protein